MTRAKEFDPDQERDQTLEAPVVTYLFVTAIVVIYFSETSCGRASSTPAVSTLVEIGASSRQLVAEGQWYRLLSSNFLHASPSHLFFNCLALALAGSLERAIGAAWFAGVFFIAAVGSSLFSVSLNPAGQVGVGASGAILGLFGAQVVLAHMHYPEGAMRTYLAERSWRILIPTLMAFTGDGSTDFAAHLGGALTGAATGLALSWIWNREEAYPHDSPIAWTINSCASMTLAFAIAAPAARSCFL